jgi:uncharacterized protein
MTEYPTGDPNTPPQYGQQPGQPQYGQQPPQYGQQPGQPQYGAAPAGAPISDADRKLWGMLAHLGGILFGFLAPLIVFLMYKDRDEFVKDQSTEALNFQISLFIIYVVSTILAFIVIGTVTFAIAWIGGLVLAIMGGLAANKGERYRYPVNIRLVK